jgi:hypothetical protein
MRASASGSKAMGSSSEVGRDKIAVPPQWSHGEGKKMVEE